MVSWMIVILYKVIAIGMWQQWICKDAATIVVRMQATRDMQYATTIIIQM